MKILISHMVDTPYPKSSGTSLWEYAKETVVHPNFGLL